MSFVLPYPNSPQNGDAGNADPVRQNFQAVAQAIQSFDGSQIQSASVQEAALASGINPRLRDSEIFTNFVYTGCIWSSVSGLNGTMTGGTVYINGYRTPVNSVGSHTFGASQDTYVAVDYLGNVTYSAVANNNPSPALPANSVWLAIVITGASSISFINLGDIGATAPVISGRTINVSDSNGQLIYPVPNQKIIGYAQITTNFSITSTSSQQVTGLTTVINLPAKRHIKVTAYTAALQAGAASNGMFIEVWDGTVGSGTKKQQWETDQANASYQGAASAIQPITAAAGSHTYNVGARSTTASATLHADVTPAYILVELD